MTSTASNGCRGRRLLVLILALGLFPRLIFGVSQEAVSGIMAVLGAGG